MRGVEATRTHEPRRSTLVAIWVMTTAALGGLMLLAGADEGPLDDPDPAHERPGLLDLFGLPAPAPAIDRVHPADGAATVVFFTRTSRFDELCVALGNDAAARFAAATTVIIGAPRSKPCPHASAVAADPDGAVGAGYGLRRPRDGGPPVGYAVVDRQRRIRYRTLDPDVAHRLGEVATILSAVP